MPINDSEYEDALDYFYESDSDEAYFSALEEQAGIPKPPFVVAAIKRNSRKRAKKKVAQKKRGATKDFTAVNVLPRLPSYIPAFNERTTSAISIPIPIPSSDKPKGEKRWRSVSDVPLEEAMSRGSIRKGKSSGIKLASNQEDKKWTVDESELTIFSVDGAMMRKYKDFVDAITLGNISPLHPAFEKGRWGIKQTKQSGKYILYSARLSLSYRVKFFINEKECKVMIYSVAKHD